MKEATRIRRKSHNSSVQFLVDDNTELRGSLNKFLSNEGTKRNLVNYLSQKANYHLSRSEFMYSISAEGRTIGNIPLTLINNQEEADALLVLLAIETRVLPLDSEDDTRGCNCLLARHGCIHHTLFFLSNIIANDFYEDQGAAY